MIDFKEKLLPIFNGNTKNVEAYLDYITSKAVKKVEVYTEQHHILPKALFPEYEKCSWNRVKLLAYDHYVAHYLLAFQKNSKMLHAINNMNRLKQINVRKNLEIITEQELNSMSEMYEEFRKDIAVNISQLNKGRIQSVESRKKNGLARLGKVNVVHREQGEKLFIQSEEYATNKNIYRFIAEGRVHSAETKRKMSENGNKGNNAYTHIISGEVRYEDAQPGKDWVIGNLKQSEIAIDRFANSFHWTNVITGESLRAKESPGENWIRKRQNFINAYSGKTSGIDLLTGEKILVETESKQIYQVVHNKQVYICDHVVFVETNEVALYVNLPAQIIDNGIIVSSISPDKLTQRNLLKNLNETDKEKYQYLVKKSFGSIFGSIQKVPAKSIAGKLSELKLSIHVQQSHL